LKLIVDGSQRAIRMRAEGRSAVRGTLPSWIVRSTAFDVELQPGSTLLAVHTPTLGDADPDQFRQANLFGGLNPDLTAIDYLSASLVGALSGSSDAWAFDRSMLTALRRDLKGLFEEGIATVGFPSAPGGNKAVEVSPLDLPRLSMLERQIPPEQVVRVAGKLDTIRHSDSTFAVFVGDSEEALRGVAERDLAEHLQGLWGKAVVITGTAHFTPEGTLQLIEAESIVPASTKDMELWGIRPQSLNGIEGPASLRLPQGPRTGVNAIFGQWPGDETDEEVDAAVDALS
jgi:hypothetical protein